MSGLSNMGWAKHSFITICYLINLYIIIIYYYYVLLSFADMLSQRLVPASDAMTVTPSHTPTLGHLLIGACQPANGTVKRRNFFKWCMAWFGTQLNDRNRPEFVPFELYVPALVC